MESYGFSQMVSSRSGKTLPSFRGGAHTVDHHSADRLLAGRTMLRDEIVVEIALTADEFAEMSAEFWGTRCGTFKSNTIILTKHK